MAANSAASNVATKAGEREIVATRVFDAPRDLVFKMWTDPKHIAQWWGPKGFTNTIHEMDVRPGGVWRFIMHGPDGRDYQNKIVYVDVVKPQRLVYDHVSGPQFHVTVTFTERGHKTEVAVQMLFESAAQRDKVAEEFGAVEGLSQTLRRLEEQLGSLRKLVLTRLFDAPRELVFKVWTDPKHVAQWWGPKGFTNPVCQWPARPGGAIRIDMRGLDGVVVPMKGVFHEIVEPERLVLTTTAFEDEQGNPQLEVLNTVTFIEHRGKTKLTLHAAVVKWTPAVAAALDGMEEGWSQSLDRVDDELAKAATSAPEREFVITRTFDAPRDLMWKAWTDSERLAQWFGPKGVTIFHSSNDLRPGGVYHYGMRMPDGTEMWGKWTYREIVKPERLVFVVSFSDAKGGVTRHPFVADWPLETLSTVTFAEVEAKTRVTVRWVALRATESERKTFDASHDGMRQGWSGTFEQLEAYLAKA